MLEGSFLRPSKSLTPAWLRLIADLLNDSRDSPNATFALSPLAQAIALAEMRLRVSTAVRLGLLDVVLTVAPWLVVLTVSTSDTIALFDLVILVLPFQLSL
jgi:hypothetical protein